MRSKKQQQKTIIMRSTSSLGSFPNNAFGLDLANATSSSPAPPPHPGHRFPAPSLKEGCGKPVFGVWSAPCPLLRSSTYPDTCWSAGWECSRGDRGVFRVGTARRASPGRADGGATQRLGAHHPSQLARHMLLDTWVKQGPVRKSEKELKSLSTVFISKLKNSSS